VRILVAEDDTSLREVLVLGLEDNGYLVDAVERGDDAMSAAGHGYREAIIPQDPVSGGDRQRRCDP